MKVKSNQEIKDGLQEIADNLGVTIAEVEFKQSKNPTLTIFIDKIGGIDLDTCEKFHRAIDEKLDQINPTFDMPYTLNVSSLGADRPFKTEEDFTSHYGQMVEVWLKEKIKGKKCIDGILQSYNVKQVVVKVDEKTTMSIELKNVTKVNEYIKI